MSEEKGRLVRKFHRIRTGRMTRKNRMDPPSPERFTEGAKGLFTDAIMLAELWRYRSHLLSFGKPELCRNRRIPLLQSVDV